MMITPNTVPNNIPPAAAAPMVLLPTLQTREYKNILFAGQMTGVEGYVESASSGLAAGINAAFLATDREPVVFPEETAHGALCKYITTAPAKHFQPMNVNFGLMPKLTEKIRDKKQKKQIIADRALESIKKFKQDIV